MCEVTPYMEATTASRGISQYTTLCSAISWRGALIFTSSVVHLSALLIYLNNFHTLKAK